MTADHRLTPNPEPLIPATSELFYLFIYAFIHLFIYLFHECGQHNLFVQLVAKRCNGQMGVIQPEARSIGRMAGDTQITDFLE